MTASASADRSGRLAQHDPDRLRRRSLRSWNGMSMLWLALTPQDVSNKLGGYPSIMIVSSRAYLLL